MEHVSKPEKWCVVWEGVTVLFTRPTKTTEQSLCKTYVICCLDFPLQCWCTHVGSNKTALILEDLTHIHQHFRWVQATQVTGSLRKWNNVLMSSLSCSNANDGRQMVEIFASCHNRVWNTIMLPKLKNKCENIPTVRSLPATPCHSIVQPPHW